MWEQGPARDEKGNPREQQTQAQAPPVRPMALEKKGEQDDPRWRRAHLLPGRCERSGRFCPLCSGGAESRTGGGDEWIWTGRALWKGEARHHG